MNKRMRIMLICAGILFGSIVIYKVVTGYLQYYFMTSHVHIVTVSTMPVGYEKWQPSLKATGTLRAISGVYVTPELAGMVKKIYFFSGQDIKQGTPLVQLNADSDIALLHSLQAQAELARITYQRDAAQYAIRAISKQTLDTDIQNLKNLTAQVIEQQAIVAKKTIKAPFSGRLGISQIDLGQYLNPGDKVVSLQILDPIYADFYVPQQQLSQIGYGLPVTAYNVTAPDKKYTGFIMAIDPAIDPNTRNAEVRALIGNPNYDLLPGMFVAVEITTGKPQEYLTLPQTAISYNPYGDVVYLVKETGKDKKGNPILTANQVFVTTGEVRGDQVSILRGIKAGDVVVTSGQLKLKNGTRVAINNTIVPPNNPFPKVQNEH